MCVKFYECEGFTTIRETSLAVRWLRLHAFTAGGGMGWILVGELRSQKLHCSKNRERCLCDPDIEKYLKYIRWEKAICKTICKIVSGRF